MIKKIFFFPLIFSLLSFLYLLLPVVSYADHPPPCYSGETLVDVTGSDDFMCVSAGGTGGSAGTIALPDFIKNISLQSIASNAAKLILAIAGLLFFFYLLFGGIRMMTSAGDEKSAASARSAVTTGLLGFLLVVAAYFIALFIEEVFHIPIINVTIPGVN
ncbi:MAG: hypothetical protein A2Y57_00335 [Candidatus Woykebacteria bacterium RBG_13_40_7b]|uniref:Uncharacterized protein n=1 Tax=Candidatus Woykebacteria bacterium RBG_13_40_7b TaxID=1802594 RepID=A0A1G1WBH3_9BACT|nr:MAG: hypothetical protein A2Y57_00335 [Candidatus Woykebacteria bacterium RBG_13_40_7b]